MRIPKNCISTDISYMMLRQTPQFESLYKLNDFKVECFFDRLEVHSNEIDEEYLSNHCTLLNDKISSSCYKNGKRYRTHSGLIVIIFSDCIFESPWKYKIQFNPRYALKGSTVENCLFDVMGEATPTNHVINRIDPAFLFSEKYFTPQLFYWTSNLKWKHSASAYSNTRRDFDNGQITGYHSNGGGARTSVYAESAKPKYMKKDSDGLIKFEIQIRKETLQKKGISTIYDLHKITDTNFFKRVEFYNLFWIRAKHVKKIDKFMLLQENAFSLGFSIAKKRLNTHKNFDRDYQRYLSKLSIAKGKKSLSSVFRSKFNNWLRVWTQDITEVQYDDSLHFNVKSWGSIKLPNNLH